MPTTHKRRTAILKDNHRLEAQEQKPDQKIIKHRRIVSDQLTLFKIKTVRIINKKEVVCRSKSKRYTLDVHLTHKEPIKMNAALKKSSSYYIDLLSPITPGTFNFKNHLIDTTKNLDGTIAELVKDLRRLRN
jgi:hypothetical protein